MLKLSAKNLLLFATLFMVVSCASYRITGKKKSETANGNENFKGDDGIVFEITAEPKSTIIGSDVRFTGKCGDSPANAQSGTLTWDYGDKSTGKGFDLRHPYIKTGTYTVTATCTVPGKAPKTDTLTITVNPNNGSNPNQNPNQNPNNGGCCSCGC